MMELLINQFLLQMGYGMGQQYIKELEAKWCTVGSQKLDNLSVIQYFGFMLLGSLMCSMQT